MDKYCSLCLLELLKLIFASLCSLLGSHREYLKSASLLFEPNDMYRGEERTTLRLLPKAGNDLRGSGLDFLPPTFSIVTSFSCHQSLDLFNQQLYWSKSLHIHLSTLHTKSA